MKILISILVAFLFMFIGVLKFNGYLDIKEVYLLGIEEMGKTGISGFLGFFENYLIIPEYIDKLYSEYLLHFINKYFTINFNQIFYGIIFIVYFIFTLITLFILSFLSEKKDKIIIFFSLFIMYSLGLNIYNLYFI